MSELCSVPRVSERFAQSNALDEDIARLKYVSGKREEALRRLGIRTVGDLLLHIPHRYLDFTRSWSIEMAPIGTVCTIIATVDRLPTALSRWPRRILKSLRKGAPRALSCRSIT